MMPIEHVRTTDNNCGSLIVDSGWLPSFRKIADIPLRDLIADNPSILLFPSTIGDSEDGVGNQPVFSLREGKSPALTTGNIMGFIGIDDIQLSIKSRFDKNEDQDYFLYHMLRRVFFPAVLDMQHFSQNDCAIDILPFLFPRLLHDALRQGIYKEYKARNYNDGRVRGRIDVPRHLRCNMPFKGNVAYIVRELDSDNKVTQLIRHTIEHISRLPNGGYILGSNYFTKADVNSIIKVTSSYSIFDRRLVQQRNATLLSHPFFSAYNVLQRLCLMILQGRQMISGSNNKVYGVLFDGAWLWEEYVFTLLNDIGYVHPRNKAGKGFIWLFRENRYKRYPDFISIKGDKILDAKYKHIDINHISRDDMHQIITYMHTTQSRTGGFVNPVGKEGEETEITSIGNLNGHGGEVAILSLKIPFGAKSYKEFEQRMTTEEESFREIVRACDGK